MNMYNQKKSNSMHEQNDSKKTDSFLDNIQKIGRSLRIKNSVGKFDVATIEYVEALERKINELEQKNKHMNDRIASMSANMKNLEYKIRNIESKGKRN